MSISIKNATKIVEERLKSYTEETKMEYKILFDKILDMNDYWVFFYNSAEFIETGNLSAALTGNAPFIIDKYEGKIYETGTANPTEFYMKSFENRDLPEIKNRFGS